MEQLLKILGVVSGGAFDQLFLMIGWENKETICAEDDATRS